MGEKYTISKKLCDFKIKKIQIYNEGKSSTLFCFTERQMMAFKIKMG
jgi:hypothetical protein